MADGRQEDGRAQRGKGADKQGEQGSRWSAWSRQARRGEAPTVYGDGQQTRCFCDVQDAVKAIMGLAECPEALGQVFKVGCTEEVTILELAEKVLAIVNAGQGSQGAREQGSQGELRGESRQTIRNSPMRLGTSAPRLRFVPYEQVYEVGFEDMRRRVPDISKIKTLTGWEPQVPLEETLGRVIAYCGLLCCPFKREVIRS